MITTKDAKKIAKKLGAVVDHSGKAHDLAEIFHNGIRIAHFGIRRGSADQGHGHIPKELHLSPHQTKSMAQCHIDYDQWIEILRSEGEL